MKNEMKWPTINFADLQDTLETMHQWLQIVGKIKLRTMPWQNHSWHSTLFVNAHGYSTYGIPYGGRIFQIDFDFVQQKLLIQCAHEKNRSINLRPMTVADFYTELFEKLKHMGIHVQIHGSPNEMEPAIPFIKNTVNKTYDPNAAQNLWKAMLCVNAVFNRFRGEFIGKCSPVHLFWGAFDLAVTRFSGRPAPLHPGGMPNMPLEVMQEAYSHEVSSAGFWPGSKDAPEPVFYSYAYPSDKRFGLQQVSPKEAFYSSEMGEFFLKYEDVRNAKDPEETLYAFLNSTYEAAVHTSKWDRSNIERP